MRFRPLPALLLLSLLSTATVSAQTLPPDGHLTLAQALQLAAENRDVAMARSALDAARGDIRSADHAPLPTLTLKSSQMDLEHGIGGGNIITDKRIDKSLGLDWTWERGDKRGLRTQAAQALAEAARADLNETRLQQQTQALQAYHELHAAQAREQEVAAIADSARTMTQTLRKRFSLGDLAGQDLSRAEIEAERARLDSVGAQLDHQRAQWALRDLLGLGGRKSASGQPVASAASAASSAPALQAQDPWPALDVAQWAQAPEARFMDILSRRSDVQAAEQRVQAAQALVDGALAQRKSDITWGVSLDHYPGTSTRQVELRLQMPLQLGYGQEGEIARARAQLQQAQDALSKIEDRGLSELRRLWQEARSAALKADSQEREILPRARQVLAQAELAYAKGASPLTDLLDARRTLRASVIDAVNARADHAKALGAWTLRIAAEDAAAPH
ncbi:TolC family protein [Roseateles koreensis]|uniref:TolC family protein n=1 Tax=Roseateles koreensis TaxID=2987526 RepID=A0ABT5KQ15_9BURK|nr:TolC family protein [Roseateles koreensis]MDC8785006.1 TolC family protein [Roseateles koreensis]